MLLVLACVTTCCALPFDVLPPPKHSKVAACILGQPRSIAVTAQSLRSELLEHWEADAFVRAHSSPGAELSDALKLRELLGSRVVWQNLTLPTRRLPAEVTTYWSEGNVYGHALEQWTARHECLGAVTLHEARRGVKYSVFVRLRLDTLLLQPLPRRWLEALQAATCSAVIPAGEEYPSAARTADMPT